MTCDPAEPDAAVRAAAAAFLEEVGVLADGWRAAHAARDRAAAALAEVTRPPDYAYGTACQHNMSPCTAAMAAGMGRCEVCGWLETGGGLLWADPAADVMGDLRAARGPAPDRVIYDDPQYQAGYAEGVYDDAAALAREYSERVGLPVTVFTAAAPIEAGALVTLLDGTTVMEARPASPGIRPRAHGVALAGADAAGLVPVVLAGSGVSLTEGSVIQVSGPAAGRVARPAPAPAAPADAAFAIGAAAFIPSARAVGEAERRVLYEALERGEDEHEALAAYRRQPGPLAGLDDATPLVVAPGPGPHRQAWRMTGAGVWFAFAGEPCAEFLPKTDPARPERMTAAALTARLATR